jgi:hypothetical protein
MQEEKTKKNDSKLHEVIENITLTYTNGMEEHFEAIRIAENGIIIGRVIRENFVPSGYIPKQSCKKIANGGRRKIKA